MKTTSWIKQQGISLLEVMLSLSIIAIILVMATRYFFTASESQRINQAKAQVTAILAASTTYGHNKGGFAAVSTKSLVDDGYLDKNNPSIDAAGVFSNPWHNPITVTAAAGNLNASIDTDVDTQAACDGLKASFPGGTCTAGAAGSAIKFALNVQQSNA